MTDTTKQFPGQSRVEPLVSEKSDVDDESNNEDDNDPDNDIVNQ